MTQIKTHWSTSGQPAVLEGSLYNSVLVSCLKTERESAGQTFAGSVFQRKGATARKAQFFMLDILAPLGLIILNIKDSEEWMGQVAFLWESRCSIKTQGSKALKVN